MSNSSSPLRLPLSQEIETPNSFNFSFAPQKNLRPHQSLGLVRLLNLSHPILKWWRLMYSTLVKICHVLQL
ncbi:hypothetical protein H5410_050014 [Solanum commersonii]|uniref:Uncharacterized protein n=1 Tax=Solanum commersonii TaxID=4109 RepID=A0A9J5WU51_SOLCO|nr:hypothetical protein H5410_050014 [Solanum commersonii]